jgi:hypothetical protein
VEQAEASAKDDDEPEFDVGGEEEKDEIMDLDEFRALLVKSMKKLGGAKVGEIMKPHKAATDVPADERRDYADKITEAMADG